MKSFKAFLEERARMTPEIRAYLGTRAKPYQYWMSKQFTLPFPLSKGMMSRMQNVSENMLAFHITDIDNLDTLYDLQGSAKSLSVSTFVKNEYAGMEMLEGVETAGGVLVEVRGDILFQGMFDIFTSPDNQGRRWIDLHQFSRRLTNDNKHYLLHDWDLLYRKTIKDYALDFYQKNRKDLEEVYAKFYEDNPERGKDLLSHAGRSFDHAKLFWVGSLGYMVRLGTEQFSKEESLRETGIIEKIQIAMVSLNHPLVKKAKQALFRLTKALFDKAEKYFTDNLLDFFEMGQETTTYAYNEFVMDRFTIENVFFSSRVPLEEIKEKIVHRMSEEEIIARTWDGKKFKDYFKNNWTGKK